MPKTSRALLQLPPATAAAIEKLGADLAVARLRRKESLKTWAQRLGVSVPTLQWLEAGDPAVCVGIVATALWLIKRDGELGKPKALIEIGSEQWVIKFSNGESVDTPLIEHATMTLAKRAGIITAETRIIHLAKTNALAVRRFDREPGRKIHSISAGTAIRAATASGDEPEIGYPQLARILRRVGIAHDGINQMDARELFRRMVFNILVGNTDDHEKNHSLLVVSLLGNGRLKLAPAYDVLPSNSGQGFQEFIWGVHGRESTLENAMSQCEAFGLLSAEAAAEVVAVIEVLDTWQEHFAHAGVSKCDIDRLAERIDDDGLLTERSSFDLTRFQSGPAKRKRPSPFQRITPPPLRAVVLTLLACALPSRMVPSSRWCRKCVPMGMLSTVDRNPVNLPTGLPLI